MKLPDIGFLLQIVVQFTFPGCARLSRDLLPLVCAKRDRGSWLEDHVGATPGRIVGQLPTVPGPDRVLSEQNIAGVEKKMITFARLKFQRAT
jgi:hypothetical protein